MHVVQHRAVVHDVALVVHLHDVRALLLLAHERRRADELRPAQVVQDLLDGAAVLREHDHARVAPRRVVATEVVDQVLLELLQLGVDVQPVVHALEHAVVELDELRRGEELDLGRVRLARHRLRLQVAQRLALRPLRQCYLHKRAHAVLRQYLPRLDQRDQQRDVVKRLVPLRAAHVHPALAQASLRV